jgi:hypothetical protein
MKTLTCDVCRKKLDNPISGRTYFHIVQHDICETCHDDLEASIKPLVRQTQPFTYGWYERLYLDAAGKAVQRGKV